MENYEKHKNEIIEIIGDGDNIAVVDDKPVMCSKTACQDCDLHSGEDYDFCDSEYTEKITAWLRRDDGEPSAERIVGQNEAWELAKKIAADPPEGFTTEEYEGIFGERGYCESVFKGYTYAEAAEKVKAWRDREKIKVGDIYYSKESGMWFVVTAVYDYTIYVMYADGSAGEEKPDVLKKCYTKTGRTLPVEDWLRQIGGQDATM